VFAFCGKPGKSTLAPRRQEIQKDTVDLLITNYAVTVTGSWRITFRYDGQDAVDVNLEDYH
jgi:plasmid maintenance system killer protein